MSFRQLLHGSALFFLVLFLSGSRPLAAGSTPRNTGYASTTSTLVNVWTSSTASEINISLTQFRNSMNFCAITVRGGLVVMTSESLICCTT